MKLLKMRKVPRSLIRRRDQREGEKEGEGVLLLIFMDAALSEAESRRVSTCPRHCHGHDGATVHDNDQRRSAAPCRVGVGVGYRGHMVHRDLPAPYRVGVEVGTVGTMGIVALHTPR